MQKWTKALEIAQCEKGLHYFYPKKPFECRIPGGLIDGRKIYIHGICSPDSQRFAVNLQTGSDPASDIAFHLNPRFDENDVVMNSRVSDEWGSEERTGREPLRRKEPFLICITNLQQGYEVELNNEWLATFNHRIPYESATNVHVDGDIDIMGVHILNNEMHKKNLISIPGGVETSQTFMVTGICDSDCSGFSLNLRCGESDEEDIAFHFNPRVGDINKVIRNSYISGSWGDEEREGEFPFVPGELFAISIVTLEDGFEVRVNGKLFTKYNHRLPVSKICKLNLEGDAKMYDVAMELPSNMKSPLQYIKADLVDPKIPTVVEIGDFTPPCSLNVIGVIHSDPTRFKINLQSGPGEDDDVMLHFNPRWDQGDPKVVLNSREGGSWADEELWAKDFPFQESTGFEINIQCEDEGYRIVIDGFEQIFKHKIDCSRVKHVVIDGCVELKRVLVC